MSLNDICTADNTRQNKGQEVFLFPFFFFFSPELLEEMFVTVISQIGFASDLEVLCHKLLIDH